MAGLEHVSNMLHGALKPRGCAADKEAVSGLAEAQHSFAGTVAEFCAGTSGNGTDSESLSLGKPLPPPPFLPSSDRSF